MAHWVETYAHEIHASVLLLDGKIENWKVGERAKYSPAEWRINLSDVFKPFTCETKSWIVSTPEEHDKVFETHAPEWFKQWIHSDSFKGSLAYE